MSAAFGREGVLFFCATNRHGLTQSKLEGQQL
jgi:hypothetical protein